MSDLLIQVILYGLAAALAAPVAVVVSAFIIGKAKRPLVSVFVFTAGAAFFDIMLAAIILVAFGDSFEDGGDAGAIVDVLLGVMFGVMGIAAIFSTESPEADAARERRVDQIVSSGVGGMFLAGIAVQVINFDAIAVYGGAMKEIAEADVSTEEAVVVALIGLAVMLIGYYGPGLAVIISPHRARTALQQMADWILAHARMLEIVTGLVLGVIFLVKVSKSCYEPAPGASVTSGRPEVG